MLLIGSAAFFWWLGCEYALRSGRYSPPSVGIPKPSQSVVNNNKTARLRLPVNLDGTAVVYPEHVAAMVGIDGQFRTELSLGEMARVLLLDPRTIAKPGSPNEINPDAVLFRAVTGRLTERAKARSRREREIDEQELGHVMATARDWLTIDFPFSLNSLRHPNSEQNVVLDAISRSARGLMRQPGAKVNAVGLPMVDESGKFPRVEFAPGYLPLEPLPADRVVDESPAPEYD
jgi:hypothetical protein